MWPKTEKDVQKCIKKLTEKKLYTNMLQDNSKIDNNCHIFATFYFRMFPRDQTFLETKMWHKTDKSYSFVSFLSLFEKSVLSHFKYICFLSVFYYIFVSFLSQFGFSKFNYLFIILIQCFVTFCQIFINFWVLLQWPQSRSRVGLDPDLKISPILPWFGLDQL